MPKDIQIQECPHDDDLDIQPRVETIRRTDDDFERRPQVQTIRRTEDGRPAKRIVSPFTSPMPVPPSIRQTSVGSLAGSCGSGRGETKDPLYDN